MTMIMTMTMARPMVAAALAAALAAGCAADSGTRDTDGTEGAAAGPGDTAAAAPSALEGAPLDSLLTQSCTNADAGFSVSYPADWQTNDGAIMPACSLFDPQLIDIAPATEIPADIAVVITRQAVPFDVANGDDFTRRIMSRDTVTVDGRRAVRVEAESTGQGLYDAGTVGYSYIIELDDAVIIAQSYAVGDPDYDTKKRVLDSMMQSLRIVR